MVNFGIIGYGFMGHHHGELISRLSYANLVGVYDIDPKQTNDVLAPVKVYQSEVELFKDPEINTVIIAVPNQLHLEMVEKAAANGKNIVCEKPAAMSVAEFDRMSEVTEAAGVIFTIHHQRRWDTDYCTAKAALETGKIGKEYLISSSLYGFNGYMHDWHVYKEFGGGMLYDWGVHLIDQLLDMEDSEIHSVYADIKSVINEEVDDYFTINIKFENGVTGRLELGTYMLSSKKDWFEHHWFIGGDKGSVTIDGFDPKGNIVGTTKLLENVAGTITMTAAGPTRSFGPPPEGRLTVEELPKVNVNHAMFFDNYKDVVAGKALPIIEPKQIRKVLKVVEMARESSETGKVVKYLE